MVENKKIALLVDVDNVKIGGEAFNELYAKLSEIGEVVYCKFYGYNDRKHIYLSEAITKYGYETAPFMRNKKRFSQLDIRIVVDAIKLNYTKPEINTYCIVAGDGDLIPLLVELKTSGRTLIDINTPYQELNYHLFDAHINLSAMGLEVETYKPKTKKVITKKVAPAPAKPVSKLVFPKPVVAEKEIVNEEPEEVIQPTRTTSIETKQSTTYETQNTNKYDEPAIEQEETNEVDDALGETLRNITERYSRLDFSNNSNMKEKIQLIQDIEDLIEVETAKGAGLKSKNADIKQIFQELQNIVDDMRSAI